jgi:LysM repeat protein
MTKRIFTTLLLAFGLTYTTAQEIITENGRAYKLHTVQKGESLYRLSINNNITQEEIIASNPKLKETGLEEGITIRIPLKEVAVQQDATITYTTHIVTKGETAYSISRMYEMSLVDFYKINQGAEKGLSEGQAVRVKTKENERKNGYRTHCIAPGETLYSIGVKYGVKAADIISINPSLNINALPIGTEVRLPDTEIPVEDNNYYYHHIAQGETLYQLGVKYNLLQEKIKEVNPGIDWSALSIGQVIAIPKANAQTHHIYTHTVRKKETLFSISQKYGVSINEIINANPGLTTDNLQKGQTLTIKKLDENAVLTPATRNPLYIGMMGELFARPEDFNYKNAGSPILNIGLFLPFDAANEIATMRAKGIKSESGIYHFKTRRFIEFYEGVRLAIDTLTKKGTRIKLNVIDTKDKLSYAEAINETAKYDLIIGPAHTNEMRSVADFAQLTQTPMVLPFGQMDSTLNDNPYLFQASVIDTITYKVIIDAMLDDCSDKHVVILSIASRNKNDIQKIEYIKQTITKHNLDVSYVTYDTKNPLPFLDHLKTDKENVLIIPTNAEAVINTNIVSIASIIDQKSDAKISLYGFGEWMTYGTIDVEVFHKLNTQLYSTFALDYKDNNTRNVIKAYRRAYNAEPVAFTPYFQKLRPLSGFSEYALWGYDIAIHFIGALQEFGPHMLYNINKHNSETVQSNFYLQNLTNWGGAVNTGLKVIRFSDNNDITVTNR